MPALAVILSFGILSILGAEKLKFRILLAFSGAFLLALILFELLPEIYEILEGKTAGILIALGLVTQMILEGISKGAEHGHVHGKSSGKFPWLVFLGLGLHALLEGIPLQHHSSYLLGIILHKIPVALILGAYLLRSGISQRAIWGFIVSFALMTPLGGFLGQQDFLQAIYPYLSALVLGILLHVSTIILFESSDNHGFNIKKLGAILFGFLLAFLL